MPNTNSLQNSIDRYISAGYTLFPLIGKVPPKGCRWPRAQFNPLASAEDFPAGNFGVKLAEDDLVIDIDPRNFPKDPTLAPVAALQKILDYKLKEASFTVKTGGGGLHIYFKKSPKIAIRGALKEYPGIEFKTSGQYVVGAGSIHPESKKPYLILYDVPIAEAPSTLIDLLTKTSSAAPQPGITAYTDDEQTINRFTAYLRTAPVAIEGESGDKTTFSVAAVAHDYGLSPDVALEIMLAHYNPNCEPPWAPDELKLKVYNAYKYSEAPAGTLSAVNKFDEVTIIDDFRVDQYGRITKNVFNTVTAFNKDMADALAFNVFSEDIVFLKPAPWHKEGENVKYWTDEETARCIYHWGRERRFEPATKMIEDALITVARQKTYHPIKNYLEGLTWDGFPRLKNWLAVHAGVDDNPYSRAVGLKMLVAAITRIYQPGYKFDYVPVLEGAQGIGKSRAVAVLGGEWYGDLTIDVHSKDTVDAMRRLWIIEVSEMETQFRTDTQALRSFLSRSIDLCRLAYGRRSKAFPRQNIFVGTMNPEFDEDAGWLKDTTGNRRYWPVLCTKINVSSLKEVRNQLWAEALVYYKSHTALHFEDTAIEEQAAKEQAKRMGTDPWYDRIVTWINCDVMRLKRVIAGNEIYSDCLGGRPTQYTRACQNRISLIMRSLGWEKGTFYHTDQKSSIRGYRRPVPKIPEDLGL